MATIVCYGDFEHLGRHPHAEPGGTRAPSRRPTAGRACSRRSSAPAHTVIAEGLNGRTTTHDEPG